MCFEGGVRCIYLNHDAVVFPGWSVGSFDEWWFVYGVVLSRVT